MSGNAGTHSDLYVNSIPAGSPYVCDTVTSGSTFTVGDTLGDDNCGWRIGDDGVRWLSTGTITCDGTVKLEERMHVYEVIAVNRRTFVVQRNHLVVAPDRDKALIRASQGMSTADIDDWHIDVRKLFSFEPIEGDK